MSVCSERAVCVGVECGASHPQFFDLCAVFLLVNLTRVDLYPVVVDLLQDLEGGREGGREGGIIGGSACLCVCIHTRVLMYDIDHWCSVHVRICV